MANVVVIGATRKKLRIAFTDEDGLPVNASGGSAALHGVSADLPTKLLDVAGTLVDGPNGVFQWSRLGDGAIYVSESDLGDLAEATFDCEVKFTDAASDVDYGARFTLTWQKALDVTP